MNDGILSFAKENLTAFEKGGVSSNEIYYFEYNGKKYVFKKPLMVGTNLSPFWQMMKNVFNFTFEKQTTALPTVYDILKDNPHIHAASFIAADETAMIYSFEEGQSWDDDNFPQGQNNAYKLGQFIGYNHQIKHKNCGLVGVEDVNNFYDKAFTHMENNISEHWNSDDETDKLIQSVFAKLKAQHKDSPFISQNYSLTMADICADQFLYENENVIACVDLDAYVIGPVEWELSFLHNQIEDWESFKKGYETYQPLPEFENQSKLFYLLMALNSYYNKKEIEDFWKQFL